MSRSRVLSFISQWSVPEGGSQDHHLNQSASQAPPHAYDIHSSKPYNSTPPTQSVERFSQSTPSSPQRRQRSTSRTGSRPTSMVQTFQPPLMDVAQDTLPELLPVFTFLNSHSNKLYQEGYFLKLHDLDSRGRPSVDRNWQECFAQLCGTILSVWDAAELDAAGDEGEVMPTFINLADASIKMIESLPMNETGRSLQNILSVSTAANNRYLFHFSSLNSLTQWTAAIRLTMFEQTTLQEAYTGSLIAGKGKSLNNIRQIMEKSQFKYEDWARVRFGAGTPWRRCWFVVTPPDEKEVQKITKEYKKKPYGKLPVFKGDLRFYETKRITKRTKPIATIKDAFSAYAVYPQSKPLIDQSTLVKIEGKITIHADAESTTDGFVFVMPELHPAVTGFEIMLRFLFRVWDTFALYGRPARLIADVRDQRGLMFAMPRDRRYGYLELLDVSTLVHADNSQFWTERDWRASLKELTSKRMNMALESQEFDSMSKASASRTSLPPTRDGRLKFDGPGRSNSQNKTPEPRPRSSRDRLQGFFGSHRRSASDMSGQRGGSAPPSRRAPPSRDGESPPLPPPHQDPTSPSEMTERFETGSDSSGHSGQRTPDRTLPPEVRALAQKSPSPQPVSVPPMMAHGPSQKPNSRPQMHLGAAAMDNATLSQLEDVSRNPVQQSPVRGPNPRMGGVYQADRGSWPDDEHVTSVMQQQYQYPPSAKNRYHGNQPSRLATIPASPFVDQSGPDSAKTPNSYFPHEDTILENPSRPTPPPHNNSSSSINRKPVPAGSPAAIPDGARGPPTPGHARARSASPKKSPSPTKLYPNENALYTPPRMGPTGLGPAFDPRGNPNDGQFGPALQAQNNSPAWSSPAQYHDANPYPPNMSPNASPGRQGQGSALPPHMSPSRQPYQSRSMNNLQQSPNSLGRPLPPMYQQPSPSQMGPPPQMSGFRQPNPIPMRGPPPQNGPYPQQNGPYPSQNGPYPSQNGPYPPPHMLNQQPNMNQQNYANTGHPF